MSIGIWQVILILVIVLILFGAGKLPKVMGDIAKGVKNFRAGMREESSDSPLVDPVSGPSDDSVLRSSDSISQPSDSVSRPTGDPSMSAVKKE